MEKKKESYPLLLTSYLYLLIFANIIQLLTVYVAFTMKDQLPPNLTKTVIVLIGLISLITISSIIGLFNRYRWGFWLYCTMVLTSVVVNYSMGTPLYKASLVIISAVILWALLKMGNKQSVWNQLK